MNSRILSSYVFQAHKPPAAMPPRKIRTIARAIHPPIRRRRLFGGGGVCPMSSDDDRPVNRSSRLACEATGRESAGTDARAAEGVVEVSAATRSSKVVTGSALAET